MTELAGFGIVHPPRSRSTLPASPWEGAIVNEIFEGEVGSLRLRFHADLVSWLVLSQDTGPRFRF